jgi:hypothetical protein
MAPDDYLNERRFLSYLEDRYAREPDAKTLAVLNGVRGRLSEPALDAPASDRDPKKAAPIPYSKLSLARSGLMRQGMSAAQANEALAGQPIPDRLVESERKIVQGEADREAARRHHATPAGRRELAREAADRLADRNHRVAEARLALQAQEGTSVASLSDEEVLRLSGLERPEDRPESRPVPASRMVEWDGDSFTQTISGAAFGDPEADDLAANVRHAEAVVARDKERSAEQ